MHGNRRADDWTLTHKIHRLQNIRPLTREQTEELVHVVRQSFAADAKLAESVDQIRSRSVAHLAVRVADDGDFLPALDGAGQRD